MSRLGHDHHGTWLFAPRGAAASYAAAGSAPLPVNFLTLVPHGPEWWMATWMWGNEEIDIDLYIDVVAPPEWLSEAHLRVVDLDLDVIRYRDGRIVLDDQDEFADNAVRFAYPKHMVAGARSAAEELVDSVRRGATPFTGASDEWFERLTV